VNLELHTLQAPKFKKDPLAHEVHAIGLHAVQFTNLVVQT